MDERERFAARRCSTRVSALMESAKSGASWAGRELDVDEAGLLPGLREGVVAMVRDVQWFAGDS
jgi:hypothetical protein